MVADLRQLARLRHPTQEPARGHAARLLQGQGPPRRQPRHGRHRCPVLLAALPTDDHHRVGPRRGPPLPGPVTAVQVGAHARLRRPLLTKSRRYSVTFGQLRRARLEHRKHQRHPTGETDPWGRPLDETVVLVLRTWTYDGTGHSFAPAAELALASAARARDHDRLDAHAA